MRKPLLALYILSAFLACGDKAEESSKPLPKSSSGPVSPPIDPATAATIRGKVLLEGTAPEQKPISMSADPTCVAMHDEEVKTALVVVNEDGSLRNTFVYVKAGLENYRFNSPRETVTLEQRGCIYIPRVLGVMTGQSLDIVNKDTTLHNVRVVPEKNPPFNVGQPGKGFKTTKSFEISEVMIPIRCDVHKWMRAYLGVLEHPCFSVSGDGGRFELTKLPPGNYVIEAWHETFGTLARDVTVGEKEVKEITFTFKAVS
jgi:hypothetical protein